MRTAAALRQLPGIVFERGSYREALWQGLLARAGVGAYELVASLADGESLGRILTANRTLFEAVTSRRSENPAWWHFITPARPG